ncbi:MAG TPA: potassium transporter TrkG, partial [bacterium]|nr:potassium transporter TrkG [bacterium]
MGTGGFSTRNGSMEAFASPSAEWITILFMFAAGVNFSLYYNLFYGRTRALVRDSEFRFYAGLMVVVTLLIAINLAPLYQGQVGKLSRDSLFQTVSMGSSTGLSTVNYHRWPGFSQLLLYLLMFMGGCAGSTSSALKQVRVVLILKAIKRKLTRLIHPQAVIPIVLGETVVSEETLNDVLVFTIFYLIVVLVVSLVLAAQGLDLLRAVSAAAAALWNLGRGFGSVELTTIYADFNLPTKFLLSVCMLLGRLEIYPIMVLLLPNFWRRS